MSTFQTRSATFSVFVRTPASEILQVKLEGNATGSELYSEVERLSGIPAAHCKILRNGKWPISSGISIVDQAIKEESTLDLCLCLKAGGENDGDHPGHTSNDSPDLRAFHKLMIGSVEGIALQDVFLTVERKKLSPEILQETFRKADGVGVTRYLVSYMVDLLKRRRSLSALTNYAELNEASEKKLTVDSVAEEIEEVDEFCEYRHKELLIALLETCPSKYHSRIISLCEQAGCPCPFVYRRVNPEGRIEVRMIVEAYSDLFSLPKYPMVLSCGTSSTSQMGKTELLSQMFAISPESQDSSFLERFPGGPCHNLSIDFAFHGVLDQHLDSFVVADVHGFSMVDSTFNIGLKVLASGAALSLVHVTSKNFADDGEPDEEVKEIISSCSDVVKGQHCCIMILCRDFKTEDTAKLNAIQETMPQVLSCLKNTDVTVRYCEVPDLRSLKTRRHGKTVKGLASMAVEMLTCKDGQQLRKMPSATQIATKCLSLSSTRGNAAASSTNAERTSFSLQVIGSKLKGILDTAKFRVTASSPPQTLFEHLFRASTLDSRLAALQERGEKILRNQVLEGGNQELEGGNKDKFADVEVLIQQVIRDKIRCQASDLIKYFAGLVQEKDTSAVYEFDRQISLWKSPICTPLIEDRIELHRSLEETLMKLRDQGKSVEKDEEVGVIHKKIKLNEEELDRYDISIDDVWSELMSLASKSEDDTESDKTLLERECGVEPSLVHQVFKQCVLEGHPMQLLRGHPLYMASDFLSAVLRGIQDQGLQGIQKHGSRKLFVVSVIGMQSSAKSTLLNYLFGCGFATRAGRCTKGLYASYMRTNEFDLLVLDSEGLMSVEGGRTKDFDNEVTLMAMACSHVVIINQKGELQRQLRELLEVALFAMKHLEVLKIKPDIVFVLRDQADFDDHALKTQFIKMGHALTKHADKLKLQISDFIDLSTDALHLFPSAFSVQERNGKKLKQPSNVFSEMILRLREQLFLKLESKFGAGRQTGAFSNMENWLVHARTVWNAIRKYGGNLVYYESMREIEQRSEISEIFKEVVASKIDSEKGFCFQCQKLLNQFLVSKNEDVASGSARIQFLDALTQLEAVESPAIEQELETKLKRSDFPSHFRQEFQSKLQRRIAEKKQSVLEAWTSHEARTKGTVQSKALEEKMIEDMKKLFAKQSSSDRRESELKSSFESEWEKNLGKVEREMMASVMTDKALCDRINFLFIEQVTDNKVQPIFAQLVQSVKGIPPEESLILSAVNEARWHEYLKVNEGLLVKIIKWTTDRVNQAKTTCVEQCRMMVNDHFMEMADSFSNPNWKLDNLFFRKLMWSTVSMIKSVVKKLESKDKGLVSLDTLKFANDVHDCLRSRVYREARARRERELTRQLTDLRQQKDALKERILRQLSGLETDNNRALDLALYIKNSIEKGWLEKATTAFQASVEGGLRGELTNAKQASIHAFNASFGTHNWPAVVNYCDNPTKFLRSIFEGKFDKKSQDCKDTELAKIETTLVKEVGRFEQLIVSWGQRWNSNDPTTTQSLKDHCKSLHDTSDSDSISSRIELKIDEFVPTYYGVTNPSVFASAYLAVCWQTVNVQELLKVAERLVSEKLSELRERIWETGKGCPDTCPFCGAKCSLEQEHLPHRKHECVKHLYPAFGGVMSVDKGIPSFTVCTSQAFRDKRYIRESGRDPKIRSVDDHVKFYYSDWKVPDLDPVLDGGLHQEALQRAWVNTRKVFLRRYKGMEDSTNDQWIKEH